MPRKEKGSEPVSSVSTPSQAKDGMQPKNSDEGVVPAALYPELSEMLIIIQLLDNRESGPSGACGNRPGSKHE